MRLAAVSLGAWLKWKRGLVSERDAGSSISGLFFGTGTVAGLGADMA